MTSSYLDFFLTNFESFSVPISLCDLIALLNSNEKIPSAFSIRSVNFFHNKSPEHATIDKNCAINTETISFYEWLKTVSLDYLLGVNVDF